VSESNILDRLREVLTTLEKISSFQGEMGSFRDRLQGLVIDMKDISEGLENIGNRVQHDPKRLDELTARLDLIHSLLQKHKVADVEGLLLLQKEIQAKLDGISTLDADIEQLRKAVDDAEEHTIRLADDLHSKRKKAIPAIETEITSSLAKLGMNEGVLRIELNVLDEVGTSGKDNVSFTFSANRGSTPAAISRIASGGELSRLMLSIKSMITAKSLLPTIILDEIDMGVSGDIAAKVASMLEDMSTKLQLIAITHLPQIAAKAGTHIKVYKKSDGIRTVSEVKCLTEGERIEEVAAMLSDENISDAAKQAAKELLGI
jgi:DNA repair protein RecN (Recombination protein N)